MSKQNLRCQVHPLETIHNFCRHPKCMIGLCASCIAAHNEYHQRENTKPVFENINKTFKHVSELLQARKRQIEQTKTRIKVTAEIMGEQKNKIKHQLNEIKREVISKVEAYFEDVRKDMWGRLAAEEKKVGLGDPGLLEKNALELAKVQDMISQTQRDLAQHHSPIVLKKTFLDVIPKTELLLKGLLIKFPASNYHYKLHFQQPMISEFRTLISKLMRIQFGNLNTNFLINRTPKLIAGPIKSYSCSKVDKINENSRMSTAEFSGTFQRPMSNIHKKNRLEVTLEKKGGNQSVSRLSRVSRKTAIFSKPYRA